MTNNIASALLGFIVSAIIFTHNTGKTKSCQIVWGLAENATTNNRIALTIVPNPNPGHTNVWFIDGKNIGVLQLQIDASSKLDVRFQSLANPPLRNENL